MSNFKQARELLEKNKVEIPEVNEPVSEDGKKSKSEFYDDGRSIVDMNVEGFSWYTPNRYKREKQQLADLKVTRKETRAMILGALSVMLPAALTMMALFFGAFLLIALWLK